MFKIKQFGVAAAMLLIASGAFANNFRAADQVYVLAAGHVASGSAVFISDVFISNLSTTDSVDVSVIYTPTGDNQTQQNFNKALTLLPNERREIVDFFPTVLHLASGFGDLVFNACKKDADCTPDLNGLNTNYRNISVESRIYSIPPGKTLADKPPTVGQLFSGIPWYMYASSANPGFDTVFITGMRNNGANGTDGTFRGNVGVVNASQFSITDLVITLYNGANNQVIGSTTIQGLGPLAHKQLNIGSLFSAFTGATAVNAYVTVSQPATSIRPTTDAEANGCKNGCPSFMAYGSVLDNSLQSGDPTTLESQFTASLNELQIACVFSTTPTANCKGGTSLRRSAKHN
jgi:hypothetical protein